MEEVREVSLDAVITLVEIISSKLQLLSQDFRGWDAVNLELTLLEELLLRTRYLTRDKDSVLFNMSEELRHFYFILRAERRLEHVMAEEFSRFRDTLKILQRQYCESLPDSTCLFEVVLDTLRKMDDNLRGLGELKVELNLFRLMNQASPEFPLSEFIPEVYDEATQFWYLAHQMADDSSLSHELMEACSSFRASLLKYCKHHIPVLQPSINRVWHFLQLNAFYDLLSASLWDIYFWGQSHPRIQHSIRPLISTVTFLKSFMWFATMQIDWPCISEWLLSHLQVSAIEAVSLGYMCWLYRDDQEVWHQLQSRSRELDANVRPGSGNIQVTQNYVETLLASTKSRSSSLMEWSYLLPLLDFVGYLHDYFFQLERHSTSVVCSDTMKRLAMKLNYLWFEINVKLGQPEGYRISKVNEAAIIIFQLHILRRKDKEVEEVKGRISQLLGTTVGRSRNELGDAWMKEDLESTSASFGNTYPRSKAAKSLQTHVLSLIVNGVRVSSRLRRTEQIKYQLLNNSVVRLELIAIVNSDAGMGTSRFADMVFQDSDIINHFKIRARCYCSTSVEYNRNRKHLLQDILDCVLPRDSYDYAEKSEDYLAEVVHRCLKGKRYLIVLYNVRCSEAWRGLLSLLPTDANQSKILLASSISDPGYFLLEPASSSSVSQIMAKMGSCCKRS